MKIYTAKIDTASALKVVADDMILTTACPTAAGSKMLDGYMSLFESEALTRLKNAGFELCGKTDVGEFAIDLLGETSYNGACTDGEKILNPTAEAVKANEAAIALTLDVNGSVRRAAAQNDLVSIKPTYGTVSRYGTIPVACSGETVSLLASSAGVLKEALDIIAGHDDKDGTSLSEELCASLKKDAPTSPVKRVAYFANMFEGVSECIAQKASEFCEILRKNGIEVVEVEESVIAASRVAWNILMSAELCNNVSRYDGVKYGYRTQNFTNLDELYTNTRTEAFGELLKTTILFGSETLSTDNYFKVYDKALRTRRIIVEAFAKIFESFDAVLMPACSKTEYTTQDIEANKYLAFEENLYTAPASITGLPALVAGGVQLVGKAFSEKALLDAAEIYEKESK